MDVLETPNKSKSQHCTQLCHISKNTLIAQQKPSIQNTMTQKSETIVSSLHEWLSVYIDMLKSILIEKSISPKSILIDISIEGDC